jgi:NAD(P)H-dependent FMN reductase
MDPRPLIISGSARKESDTKKLVDIIFSGFEIEQIELLDYTIDAYNYKANYSPDDNFFQLIDIILNHNKIIFATPVYWYAMSGRMKNFFDRLTDIVTIRKEIGRKMKGKEIFLLSVGTDPAAPDGFEIPFRLTAEYFDMNFISSFYCKRNNLDSVKSEGLEFLEKLKASQ